MSSMMPRMSPLALQQQFRRVAVNQAVSARAYSSYFPKVSAEKRLQHTHRPLSTTKHLNTSHDNATIDFAYMPQGMLNVSPEPETFRVPLLPDNFTPPMEHTNNAHRDVYMESVVRPQISTTSANGTHIDSPSAMSDVTDNHALEIDVFDLTKKVGHAATAAATKVTGMSAKELEKKKGMLSELFSGMIDDIFGSKTMAKA
ncbi:MAG: hypothetical protein Q9163_002113 [Psora crenata]